MYWEREARPNTAEPGPEPNAQHKTTGRRRRRGRHRRPTTCTGRGGRVLGGAQPNTRRRKTHTAWSARPERESAIPEPTNPVCVRSFAHSFSTTVKVMRADDLHDDDGSDDDDDGSDDDDDDDDAPLLLEIVATTTLSEAVALCSPSWPEWRVLLTPKRDKTNEPTHTRNTPLLCRR